MYIVQFPRGICFCLHCKCRAMWIPLIDIWPPPRGTHHPWYVPGSECVQNEIDWSFLCVFPLFLWALQNKTRSWEHCPVFKLYQPAYHLILIVMCWCYLQTIISSAFNCYAKSNYNKDKSWLVKELITVEYLITHDVQMVHFDDWLFFLHVKM